MKVSELRPGMIIRFPEEPFEDDKAKVVRIDHDDKRVYFQDIAEDFPFDSSFEEVEEIAKPL